MRKGGGDVFHGFAVAVDDRGVQDDRVLGLALADLREQLLALGAGGVERGEQLWDFSAIVGDHRHQAIDLCGQLIDLFALGALGLAVAFLQLRPAAVIMLHRSGDLIRVQQVLLQTAQHLALKHRIADLATVGAGAGAARIGAAPMAVGDNDHRAVADAAPNHAREQALWAAVDFLRDLRARAEGQLQSLPLLGRNDLELGHRRPLPLFRRVGPRHAATGIRITHHVGAIVDQGAAIDFVPQDAVLPPVVAVDHRYRPFATCRRWHALGIQPAGDRARRIAFEILADDSPDDLGLIGINLAQAKLGLAARIHAVHLSIAIGQIAGDAARRNAPALPAPDLVRHVLAEQRGHGALEADLELVDLALGEAEDTRPGMDDVIVQPAHIALVAREAIQRLCEHLVGLARLDMLDQSVEAWAVAHGPGNGEIGEDRRYRPAFTLGVLLADPDLILDRPGILKLAAVARIDGCPHESLPPLRAHGRAVPVPRQAQW